jgi:hypothetical protein
VLSQNDEFMRLRMAERHKLLCARNLLESGFLGAETRRAAITRERLARLKQRIAELDDDIARGAPVEQPSCAHNDDGDGGLDRDERRSTS